MGNIAKFDVMNASNRVTDMYDADNFYPFSGLDADGEGLDIEFSEALGDKLRAKIKERQEGLGERLSRREQRIKDRQARKKARQDARGKRKDLRQITLFKSLAKPVEKVVEAIVAKNPVVETSVDAAKEGIANEKEEKVAEIVIEKAKEVIETGSKEIPIIPVDEQGEVKTSWWETKSTGIKVAIIGGGVLVLGAIAYFIVKSKK